MSEGVGVLDVFGNSEVHLGLLCQDHAIRTIKISDFLVHKRKRFGSKPAVSISSRTMSPLVRRPINLTCTKPKSAH